jgi:uncharacterized alpha-E superfamily protein
MTKQERFELFIRTRYERNDWAEYLSYDRTALVRRKILEKCDFPRSTLYQNAKIKSRLAEVEGRLLAAGTIKRAPQSLNSELLEEPALLAAAAALESRLNGLANRIAVLMAAINAARTHAMKYHGES